MIIGAGSLGLSIAEYLRYGIDTAELATALEKDPAIQKVAVEALGKAKYIVQDEATHTAFKENLVKTEVEKVIGTKIREVHDQYDKDLKEVFGDKFVKNQDEKSYEALKRVGKSVLTELQTKITTIEDQMKKGDPTGVLAKRLEEAELNYKNELAKKDTELSALRGQTETAAKSVALQTAYQSVAQKFIKNLPPFFTETKDTILNSLLKDSILKDGVLYVGENGIIKKDSGFNEIKIEDYLKVKFKDVIDTKPAAGGAGSGGNGGAGKQDPTKWTVETYELPGGVTTPGDLLRRMAEDGLVRGTPLFNSIWAKLFDDKTGKIRGIS